MSVYSKNRLIFLSLLTAITLLITSCVSVDSGNNYFLDHFERFKNKHFEAAHLTLTSNQEFQFSSQRYSSENPNQFLHLFTIGENIKDIDVYVFKHREGTNLEALAHAVANAIQIPFTSATNIRRRLLKNFEYPAIEYRGNLENQRGEQYKSIITLIQAPCYVLAITEIDRNANSTSSFRAIDADFPLGIQFEAGHAEIEQLSIPDNAFYLNGLGLYFHANSNLSKAVPYFVQAFELDPEDATIFLNAITTLLLTDKVDEAITLLDKHQESFPENIRIRQAYAHALVRSGRISQGVEIYDQLFAEGLSGKQFLDDCFGAFIQAKALDQGLELATRWTQGNEGSYIHLWQLVFLREQGRIEEAYESASQWKETLINETDFGDFYVDLLLRKGSYAEAITEADALLLLSSNQDLVFYKAVAYSNLGQYVSAKELLEDVIAANPTHAAAKQFLSQVTSILGQTDTSLLEHEIEAVPLKREWLENIPAADPSYLAQKGALAEEVAYALNWKENESVRITVYKRFKVRDDSALAELKETILSFDPLNERIYINELTVYDAEGTIVGRGDINQYYQTDPNLDNILTTEKELHLPTPNLTVGGSFQLTYTRERNPYKGHFGFEIFQPSGIYPRKIAAIQISGDIDRLDTQILHTTPIEFEDENHKMWIVPEPLIYENHPFRSDGIEYLPSILVKSKSEATWESIGSEYWDEISELYAEAVPEIETEIDKLDISGESIEEKVKSIADYMSKQYNYTALNFGRHASIPHAPKTILSNKFGDCKDLALIMHHYLKAVGIDSYPALVKSGEQIVESMPSMDQFNHVVLYIPDLPGCPIVDPTDQNMPIGLVPRSTSDNSVLIIQPDSIRFLHFPHYTAESSLVELDRSIAIEADGMVSYHEIVQFHGVVSTFLRDNLTDLDPNDHVSTLLNILNSMGANLPLSKVEIEGLHHPQDILKITYDYQIQNTKSVSANTSLVSLLPTWTSGFFYHQRDAKERTAPIKIFYPITVHATESIHPPSHWQFLPQSLSAITETNNFGQLETTHVLKPEHLTLTTRATLLANDYPASAYPQLADYLTTVYQKTHPSILFEELPEGATLNAP